MLAVEDGKRYNVVIVGSTSINDGYNLVNDAKYPGMASDFEKTFQVLAALPCDVFLGAHGIYYGMEAKYRRLLAGDRLAFVDPAGYKAFVAERERGFAAELAKQRGGR